MALIKPIRGFIPIFGNNCYLAENATIIGDVIMGNDCSVWFNTVLRGDVNSIRIGNRVNIQDGSMLHTTYNESVVEIGDDVTIGHHVVVHGARIEPNVLIGIGAILLDHVVVNSNTIVAAGSVVLERTVLEPNSIYGGVPARRLKTVDPAQVEKMIRGIARNYIEYTKWYTGPS